MDNPGKSTTEFWLIIGFMAIFLANGTHFVNIPWEQMWSLAGIIGVYAGGRSYVKGQSVAPTSATTVASTGEKK